jgi:hypothetical protein
MHCMNFNMLVGLSQINHLWVHTMSSIIRRRSSKNVQVHPHSARSQRASHGHDCFITASLFHHDYSIKGHGVANLTSPAIW